MSDDTQAERTEDAAGLEIGQTEAREAAPIYHAMIAEFGDPFETPEGAPRTAPGHESGPGANDAACPEAAAPSGPDYQEKALDAVSGADTPEHG